jgi:hypothetical protein
VKRLAALLFLLPASCGPETKDTTVEAVKAFENWVRACVAGDGDTVFRGMSDGFKSGWLFDRLTEADPLARRWRGDLTGTARTDLDLWLGLAKKRNDGRQEPLPQTVLAHPSLLALFKDYFASEGRLRSEMSRTAIGQAFADDTGVTVVVKNGAGSTELYGLIAERDGWKVDAHREPLGQR